MTRTVPGGVLGSVGMGLLGVYLLVATVGQLHGDPTALVEPGLTPPSWAHPFGTDPLGRDLLARTASGAWTSLVISASAVGLACALAIPLGLAAAWWYERWPDTVVMRIVETTQVVPPFVLVLLLLGLSGSRPIDIGPFELPVGARVAACLAVGFVPFFARIVRSATLSELREPYIGELRQLGVPVREVVGRELLPNIVPAVAVQALLALAIVVFAEGGLSYLGLGVPPPEATLGNLIAEAGAQLLSDGWWFAFIPGLVLMAGITGLNLVADATSDRILGPGHRPSRALLRRSTP